MGSSSFCSNFAYSYIISHASCKTQWVKESPAMKSHGVVGGGVCGQEVVVRGRAEKKGIRGR